MVTAIRPATITSRPVVFVAMKFERAAGLLAWAGWAATAVLLAAAAVLFVFNLSHDVLVDALTTDPVLGFVSIVFATLGRLIVSRHPRNIVGWLLLVVGVLFAVTVFASEYAIYGLITNPDAVPGERYGAWVAHWLVVWPYILTATVFLLLFPDGRPLARRWAWVCRSPSLP